MSVIRKLVKAIVPLEMRAAIRNFIARKNYRKLGRSTWLNRPNTPEDNHVDVYWKTASHPNRRTLLKLILNTLKRSSNGSYSVLEFGSHVGVNLKNLRDAFPGQLNMYAVEPNQPAAESLRSMLPEVRLLEGEDERFLASTSFPDSKVLVSFVNAVFYCMDAKRTKAVLRKLTEVSEFVIIGDEIENAEGDRTLQDPTNLNYRHPYSKWFREFGFSVVEQEPAPEPKLALNGFLVAKKDT